MDVSPLAQHDGSRRLRVAMVAFPDNHHTNRWSRALAAAGLDVQVVGATLDGPMLESEQAARQAADPSIRVVSAAQRWREAIAKTQPDVVYMQWLFARPAMLLALDRQWPLVTTVMGSDVRQDPTLAESVLERTWRTALLLRSSAVTVVAQPLADVVLGYAPSLSDRLHIVPFGVDTAAFQPPSQPRNRQPGDRLAVGHFKSDDPVYGRLEFLQAALTLLHEGQALELHLAGRRGNDQGRVSAFLDAHPDLAACVVDHGLLSVDEIARAYQEIDVYVMNSYQESFGVAAAEALATGVPVVASDVGGVRALVREGDTGLLVPPGDAHALAGALREFAQFPDLARSSGARGRARIVARFEWSASVAQVCGLLHTAASAPPGAAVPVRPRSA